MKKRSLEEHVLAWLRMTCPGAASRTITRDTDLVSDLDVDSMAMVSLIFSIDEAFHVGTDQMGDLVANCRSVGDLVAATERLLPEPV